MSSNINNLEQIPNAYYDFDYNKKKFLKNINSWYGTPYHHMGELKHRGVDCTKFIGLFLIEMGIMSQLEPNVYYSRDWCIHGQTEIVMNSIENHYQDYLNNNLILYRAKYPLELKIGDLILFACFGSKLSNHTAFYKDNNIFVHCNRKIGVVDQQITKNWEKRITYVYRLFQK